MPRRAARRGAAAAIVSRLGLTSCDALDGRGVADGPPGHFCSLRSRGVGGGETGGALRTGGGFASGPGRVVPARAEARRAARGGPAAASLRVRVRKRGGASWGEAGGARGLGGGVTSGPGLAARAGARRAVREGSVAASLPAQRRELGRGGWRTGARRRLHFRPRSSGASWGEAGGARGHGDGFTSGPGLAARAGARRVARGGSVAASLPAQRRELGRGGRRAGARRRLHFRPRSSGASWGEAGGARGPGGGLSSGLAARAGARRAASEGSAAACLQRRELGRGGRCARARWRRHFRPRSSGASWGEAGGARGHGGGFTSGPGLAARAGARRVAHGGTATASLPAQRRELGRGGWRAGARWRRHFRPRSSGASWGEAGGALGHGGGFTSGPDLAARAGARRAARGGPAAACLQRRELGRGGRRAGARRRLHFRPRSSGASWGEAGGALGHGGGFTSGPGLAARAGARRAARGGSVAASLPAQRRELGRGGRRARARRRLHFRPRSSGVGWGEAGGARGLGGGFTSGPGPSSGASWGEAGGALGHGGGFTSGPGLAARAGARRVAHGGTATASLPAQRRELGRGGRRAGARRRLHFRPRSSGASWGEAGGARGLGGGVTSGPGLAARAGARRAARKGAAAASLPAQRRELGRGGRCARARWRRHFRPRSSGASWGEAGGARGLGGGVTSGPGLAAQAGARRAARWGTAAASLPAQV
eukprot:tig00021013_g17050.t3